MNRMTTIKVDVDAMYAAEIAEVFAKRLTVLNYEHTIHVDEQVQVDLAIERERKAIEREEMDRVTRTYLGSTEPQWDVVT